MGSSKYYCLFELFENLSRVAIVLMVSHGSSARIWIGQIAKKTNVDDVKEAFSQYGKIVDFKFIPKAYDSFAFVEFSSEEEASRAIRMGDGLKVSGSILKVNSANPVRENKEDDRRGERTRSSFYGDNNKTERRRSPSERRRSRSKSRERKRLYKIEIQNLPKDMTAPELKRLANDYVKTLEYSRIVQEKDSVTGFLEFAEKRDGTKIIDSLNGKRMEDSDRRLKVIWDESDDESPVRRRR